MINWQLYPEKGPLTMRSYLVTFIDKDNKKQVTVGWIVGGRWYYKYNNVNERIESVVAWADLPEPYIGDEVVEPEVKKLEWWEED